MTAPHSALPILTDHPARVAPLAMDPPPSESISAQASPSSDAGALRLTEALQAELDGENHRLEGAAPETILQWAVDRFRNRFTFATAFGPEGMCIVHMLAKIAPQTTIFNLDTGYQFPETLAMQDRIRRRYGIDVQLRRPAMTTDQYEAMHGGPLYKTNPSQCCFDRKITVLREAILGKHAWASAIRRDQSPDRAKAPLVGWDAKFGLVKISPLANWTRNEVWRMITDHDIPYNPLHDQGYPSIGCAPCTRAVGLGCDERAGRWSGTEKTECGLHSLD